MQETMSNAIPIEVGGNLRSIMGAREAAERMNSVKFKQESRRLEKEHELPSLEEAIFVIDTVKSELLDRGCPWRF